MFQNTAKSNTSTTMGSDKAPSEKQVETYLNLCARKGATPESFSTSAEYSKEIQLLFDLPDYRPISEGQLNAITKMSAELEIQVPSDIYGFSSSQASDLIEGLMAKLPPTEGQNYRLLDLYRFNIIDIDVSELNRASASTVIRENETELIPSKVSGAPISWGKATISQWIRYCTDTGVQHDVREFSKLTRDEADQMIKDIKSPVKSVNNSTDEKAIQGIRHERNAEHPTKVLYLRFCRELDVEFDKDLISKEGEVHLEDIFEVAKAIVAEGILSVEEVNELSNDIISDNIIVEKPKAKRTTKKK